MNRDRDALQEEIVNVVAIVTTDVRYPLSALLPQVQVKAILNGKSVSPSLHNLSLKKNNYKCRIAFSCNAEFQTCCTWFAAVSYKYAKR